MLSSVVIETTRLKNNYYCCIITQVTREGQLNVDYVNMECCGVGRNIDI